MSLPSQLRFLEDCFGKSCSAEPVRCAPCFIVCESGNTLLREVKRKDSGFIVIQKPNDDQASVKFNGVWLESNADDYDPYSDWIPLLETHVHRSGWNDFASDIDTLRQAMLEDGWEKLSGSKVCVDELIRRGRIFPDGRRVCVTWDSGHDPLGIPHRFLDHLSSKGTISGYFCWRIDKLSFEAEVVFVIPGLRTKSQLPVIYRRVFYQSLTELICALGWIQT